MVLPNRLPDPEPEPAPLPRSHKWREVALWLAALAVGVALVVALVRWLTPALGAYP